MINAAKWKNTPSGKNTIKNKYLWLDMCCGSRYTFSELFSNKEINNERR
jgi:hypothetical protein